MHDTRVSTRTLTVPQLVLTESRLHIAETGWNHRTQHAEFWSLIWRWDKFSSASIFCFSLFYQLMLNNHVT